MYFNLLKIEQLYLAIIYKQIFTMSSFYNVLIITNIILSDSKEIRQ